MATIKKSHKGLLHKNLGIPQNQKIPASKLAIKSTDSPAVKKRKQFAINFRHKAEDGYSMLDENPPLKKRFTDKIQPLDLTPQRQPLRDTINENPYASMVPTNNTHSNFDFSNALAMGLGTVDALIPNKRAKNPVVQPYTNYSYNEHPYGISNSQMLMKDGGMIPKNTIINGKKVTSKQRKFFSDLCKMELGGKMQYDFGGIISNSPTPIEMSTSLVDEGDDPKKKKKKLKGFQNELNTNYSFNGIIDENGKPIDHPTEQAAMKTMIEFMKHNWDNNAPNPSNNYIPQWQHTSYDPRNPVVPIAKKGMKMKAINGIQIENNNYNQLSPSTLELTGKTHAEGGTDINFSGKTIEAEKGEPISMDNTGNLTVFGNMKNPLTGNKYKLDAKMLAKKENKARKFFDNGLELINNNDPKGKYSAYAFNSGKAMMMGGKGKLDEINQAKEHLGELQNAHLQLIGEGDHTAKNGIKMYPQGGQTGPGWEFRGTNTKGLDSKIMDFVKIAELKGMTGYSGPQSGVSQRNTKSGHLSRHAQKQALDMIFSQPDAYQKILNDPDLSGYLINNGLTAINEYDPKVASKTGATQGHIHIGYDKGTPTSDQFRMDAKTKWSKDNPTWNWNNRVSPNNGKPLQGPSLGDIYDTPQAPTNTPHDWTYPESDTASNTPGNPPVTPTQLKDYQFNFNVNKRKPYSNAKPLDLTNLAGEAYSLATNKQEPVFMQQYQPELYNPYQVSFQDRINQNNRTFNADQQLQSYNPEALSTLSGEEYNANNQVAGDEFRTNQGIASDITNKNISLLNEAKGKNLQLADLQYQRQEQAKSNTKAINQEALNSISSKVLQNTRENNALRVYENLYPDYRFDKNYQKDYVGAPASEAIDWQGNSMGNQDNRQTVVRDRNGNIIQTRSTQDNSTNMDLKQERLKQLKEKDIPKLKKGGSINPRRWLSQI